MHTFPVPQMSGRRIYCYHTPVMGNEAYPLWWGRGGGGRGGAGGAASGIVFLSAMRIIRLFPHFRKHLRCPGGFRTGRRGAYWRPPGNPSSGVPFVCPAPRKKPALRAPAFPYAGMPPGSVSCLLSYSISHVAPECSSSSTERILLCALTFSTCRATSRS